MAKSSINLNKFSLSNSANLILTLLLCLTVGFGGGWLGARSYDRTNGGSLSQADQQIALSESQLINGIAEQVGPSVVSIEVVGTESTSDFFGFRRQFQTASAGTGVILTSSGDILTNRHVVPAGTDSVAIVLEDGTRFEDVEVVGRTNPSDSLDIAFLKIKDLGDKQLTPAKLGDSADLKVGDKVVAIGNALGEFQNTVTSGIVSGFGRNVVAGDRFSSESLVNLIQTDTAINQGNSGGPLVNINGAVIGINTAVAGGTAENIGFAIPVNDIKSLIASVLETGELQRPYLGVRYVTLNQTYAKEFDLPTDTGAYIVESERGAPSILKDSPAEEAGLKAGDIITKIGDEDITEDNNLSSVVNRRRVGDTVTVTYLRDGNEQTVNVTLKASPSE